MATKARFKGDGSEFLNGVPARDLSDDEYDALSDEQKAAVLGSTQLYSVRDAKAEREELPEELVQPAVALTEADTPKARKASDKGGGE
jgi:hypothetical protein